MLRAPEPVPPEVLARKVLHQAANDGEAVVSLVRGLFCSLVLVRFLTIDQGPAPGGTGRALFEVSLLCAAIAGSFVALLAARRGRFGTGGLVASILGDALICFGSLLSTVLWPTNHYLGILRSPDPAAFVVVVSISALRLTPVGAWVGTAANLGLLFALVVVDQRLNGFPGMTSPTHLGMLLLFVGGAGAVASVTCAIGRRIVLQAGEESGRVAHARWRFGALLREHHDVRTLLSAATLRAGLLGREAASEAAKEHVRALASDLAELAGLIDHVKVQAFGELMVLDASTPVAVAPVLRRCVEGLAPRFPGRRFELGARGDEVLVRMQGGERGLMHVVSNLLTNACEGNGTRGAERIQVEVTRAGQDGQVRLTFTDDGPGFDPGVLEDGRPRGQSTKSQGNGLGLLLVTALVEASGGRLRAINPGGDGARVEVCLPQAN